MREGTCRKVGLRKKVVTCRCKPENELFLMDQKPSFGEATLYVTKFTGHQGAIPPGNTPEEKLGGGGRPHLTMTVAMMPITTVLSHWIPFATQAAPREAQTISGRKRASRI